MYEALLGLRGTYMSLVWISISLSVFNRGTQRKNHLNIALLNYFGI